MRIVLLLILVMTIAFNTAFTQSYLNGPETIVYDPLSNCYFVSNMNGYVVKINELGDYSYFFDNCSGPYGMTIVDGVLYVNCDRGLQGGIVGIELETELEVFQVFNSGWYGSLNGLTADASGHLYTAHTGGSMIIEVDIASSTYDLLTTGIALPNAIYYDSRNDRLLVTSNVWWTPVYQIDMETLSVTPATTTTGQFSGIAEDAMHNYYIAFFNLQYIYRFDSDFSNPLHIVDNVNGPEGIYFDNLHSQLCIPVLMSNYVDFVPMEVDAWCTGGTSYGWAPLEVQFEGASIFDIAEWHWDFGDGYTSDEQFPLHVYEIPGLYNVELKAITDTDDEIRHILPRKVYNLADTIWVENVDIAIEDIEEGYEFDVTIYVRNSIPVYGFRIPVDYSGDLALTYNSFSVDGCLAETFEVIDVDINTTDKQLLFELYLQDNAPKHLIPGSGSILRLHFTAYGSSGIETTINIKGINPPITPRFYNHAYDFEPVANNGIIRILALCGDVDSNGDLNLLDIVYLIDWKFKGGPPPDYMNSSDVNGDSAVDILDIVYLIDWKFKNGPLPTCVE